MLTVASALVPALRLPSFGIFLGSFGAYRCVKSVSNPRLSGTALCVFLSFAFPPFVFVFVFVFVCVFVFVFVYVFALVPILLALFLASQLSVNFLTSCSNSLILAVSAPTCNACSRCSLINCSSSSDTLLARRSRNALCAARF